MGKFKIPKERAKKESQTFSSAKQVILSYMYVGRMKNYVKCPQPDPQIANDNIIAYCPKFQMVGWPVSTLQGTREHTQEQLEIRITNLQMRKAQDFTRVSWRREPVKLQPS